MNLLVILIKSGRDIGLPSIVLLVGNGLPRILTPLGCRCLDTLSFLLVKNTQQII